MSAKTTRPMAFPLRSALRSGVFGEYCNAGGDTRYLRCIAGASYLDGRSRGPKQEASPCLISPLGTASDPSIDYLGRGNLVFSYLS